MKKKFLPFFIPLCIVLSDFSLVIFAAAGCYLGTPPIWQTRKIKGATTIQTHDGKNRQKNVIQKRFFCRFSRFSYFADRVEMSFSQNRYSVSASNNSRLFFNLLDCPDYFSFSFGKLFSLYPPHLA